MDQTWATETLGALLKFSDFVVAVMAVVEAHVVWGNCV